MTFYETLMIEDFTDSLQFENCSHVGVPYCLFKIGRRIILNVTIDIQANARLIIPWQCKKANIVQGQCVATGNTCYEPSQPFYVLINYGDGSLYFSAKNFTRITFTATWYTES